jgi:protein-S-isoprenylcysteine O-methyltransferase Ste14
MIEHEGIDRPNRLPWPPILYAIGLVLPWALQEVIELPLLDAGDLGVAAGWALIGWGLVIGYLAIRSFAAIGTPVDPTSPAHKLATFGPYSQTRNPMYLGVLIAFAGLALSTGNLWRLAALPLLWFGLTRLAIEREEAHLARRFGPEWVAYAARVPRWIARL